MVTTSGWSPAAILVGRITLSCITPETKPGPSPAKLQFAGCPPTVTETSNSGPGVNGGVEETVVTLPVTPAGDVSPSPVRYTTTVSPRVAGLPEVFWLLLEFRIAPGPVP